MVVGSMEDLVSHKNESSECCPRLDYNEIFYLLASQDCGFQVFPCFFPSSVFLLLYFLWVVSCVAFWFLLHALSDVLPHFSNQPRCSNIATKHVCKAFLQYGTFDFGASPNRTPTQKMNMINTKETGRKQDPNAEGKRPGKK